MYTTKIIVRREWDQQGYPSRHRGFSLLVSTDSGETWEPHSHHRSLVEANATGYAIRASSGDPYDVLGARPDEEIGRINACFLSAPNRRWRTVERIFQLCKRDGNPPIDPARIRAYLRWHAWHTRLFVRRRHEGRIYYRLRVAAGPRNYGEAVESLVKRFAELQTAS